MTADPQGELLDLPPEYGAPSRVLAWTGVRTRLEEAPHSWLATTGRYGRPHAVPVDGLTAICWPMAGPRSISPTTPPGSASPYRRPTADG